jgi:hypothetical protein
MMPTIINVVIFVVFAGLVVAVIVRSGKFKPKW